MKWKLVKREEYEALKADLDRLGNKLHQCKSELTNVRAQGEKVLDEIFPKLRVGVISRWEVSEFHAVINIENKELFAGWLDSGLRDYIASYLAMRIADGLMKPITRNGD